MIALWLALALVLSASAAHADVTVDSVSVSPAQASVTTFNWAHTQNAGISPVMLVGVSHVRGGQSTTVTGVTCGAQTLALVPSSRSVDTRGEGVVEWWSLVGPVGSCTITVTFGAAASGVAGAIVFAGVDQVAPLATPVTATGTGADATIAVPSALGALTAAIVSENTFGTNGVTTSAGVQRWNVAVGTNTMVGAGSTVIGTAGSATHSWTLNNAADRWTASAVLVKVTGTADTQPPTIPAGLVATATASDTVVLAWSPSTDNVGVVNYRVERCVGAGCVNFAQIAAPTSSGYTDTPLQDAVLLRYRVRAWDGTNFSGYSAIAEATTLSLQQATLRWTPPVGGSPPDGYLIQRCTTTATTCPPSGTYATVVGTATASYVDTTSAKPVTCYNVQSTLTGTSGSAFTSTQCTTAASPILSVSPPSMVFTATVGGTNPASQTLTITNPTGVSLVWTVGDNQAWLNEAPSSGTNTTLVTVSVSISGLTAGTYDAVMTVSAPGATGSPAAVPVQLQLSPAVTPTVGRGGRIR